MLRRVALARLWSWLIAAVLLASVANADLIAYWPFDEGTGSQVVDHAGNNDGDVNFTPLGAGWVTGFNGSGSALDFTPNDYVNTWNDSSLHALNAITVSAWAWSDTGSNGHIVSHGGGWGDPGQGMWWYNGNIRVEIKPEGGGHVFNDNPAPATDGWHHVAYTWDSSDGVMATYIDGVQGLNTANVAGPMQAPTQDFNIGRNDTRGQYFDGKLDDVAIWNERLDASAIAFLAAGGSPTGALPTELTWDSTVNNYGTAHWLGGPPAFPTAAEKGIINAGQVTVEANHAAVRLDLTGGELIVGAGNTLDIAGALNSAAGSTVTLQNGSTLALGSGNIASLQTNGNATVNARGNVEVSGATFDGGGATGTFTKTGLGTLDLDNSTGTGVIGVQNLTFDVQQGTLHAVGAQPLGGTSPTTGVPPEVILSGGKLTLEGGPGTVLNNLTEAFYSGDGAGLINPLGPGLGYLAGTPLYEGMYSWGSARMSASGQQTILDLDQDPAPSDWSFRSDGAIGTNDPNNFGAVWRGQMYVGAPGSGMPLEAGDITLATASDDGSTWWVDGSLAVDNNFYQGRTERSGDVNLTEGWHDVYIGWYEGGGGANMEAKFGQGAGVGYGSLTFVDPNAASQAGMWRTVGPGDIDMTGTAFTVAASSELEVISGTQAALGALTLDPGTTLTTSGAPMSFTSTLVDGTATINTGNSVSVLTYDDGAGAPRTLIKDGVGGLSFDNTTPGTVQATSTTFQVDQGTLIGKGIDGLGGSPEVVLNGGTLVVKGNLATTPNQINYAFYDGSANTDLGAIDDGVANGINGGLFALTPSPQSAWPSQVQGKALWTGEVWQGGNISDTYSQMWYGMVNVPVGLDGTYSVYVHGDDHEIFWLDRNQNGEFDSGEAVTSNVPPEGWNSPKTGTVPLVGGQSYLFAIAHNEGGGGDFVNVEITAPLVGTFRINPGDPTQAGLWSSIAYGAIDMTGTDVTVDAPSTLNAITDETAAFGALTFRNNSALTTTGGPTSFISTSIVDASGTLNTQNTVDIGDYIGGSGKTLIKDGPGTMIVDNVAHTINGAGTTFQVNQGTLTAQGGDPLGGATTLTLAGGTASFGDAVAPPAAIPGGALGAWTFNDGTANDSSGNNYHGTQSGGSYSSSDVPDGLGGQSINLNGNGYINVDDGAGQTVFDLDTFTVATWVKEWPDGGWEPYISKRGESGQGWQLRRYSGGGAVSGDIAFTLRGPGNDDFHTAGGTSIESDGLWHHLVGTYGDGFRNIYLDGALVATESRSGGVNNTGSQLVFSARDNSGNAGNPPSIGNQANVWLDDIYIYNRALSQAEIQGMMPQRTAPDVSAINVQVTANSTLESRSRSQLDFANLAFPNNVELTVAGGPMSFANVIGTGAVNSSEDIGLRDVDNSVPGGGGTLIKRGTGALNLPDGGPTNASLQTFQVEDGSLNAGGSANPLSGADLTFAGGTVNLTAPKGPGVIPTGALGAWTFDAGNANDSSGNNYHGTQNGGVYSSDVPEGLSGQSINLNGNGYINVDDGVGQTVFDLDTLSVVAWVKEWPDGNWEPYVSKRGESGQGWQLRRHGGSDGLSFTLRGTSGNDDGPVGADRTIDDNPDTWYLIAGTYDGAERKFYVNGILDGEVIPDTGAIANTGSQLVFGARDNSGNAGNPPSIGNHSNTWLDDIYIYDRALTQAELLAMLPKRAALVMPDTNVRVAGGGTLNANTDSTATFGDLTMVNGALKIQGAPEGVFFANLNVDPGASTATLNSMADVTVGNFDGGGATATLIKQGDSDLTITGAGANAGGVSLQVMAGRLNTSQPMTVADLLILGNATAGTGGETLTVNNSAIMGGLKIEEAGGGSFGVRGGELSDGRTVYLTGGTVALSLSPVVRPTAADGAIANWRLDDAVGATTAIDSIAGNTGTVNGNPVFNPAGGTIAGGLFLDGSGDNIEVPTVDVANDSFSLSIWARRDPANNGRTILFGQGDTGGAYQAMHFGINNDDQALFNFYSDDLWITRPAWADFNDDQWHHWVGVWDNANLERAVYLDGVEIGRKTGGNIGTFVGTGSFYIGRQGYNTADQFDGGLDDAWVFNRVLTQDEINRLHSAGLLGWRDAGGGLNQPTTDFNVSADSTLFSDTATTATYGDLTMDGAPAAILTLTGAPEGTFFNSIAMDITGFAAGTEHDQLIFADGHPIADGSILDIFTPLGTFGPGDVDGLLTLMELQDPQALVDGFFIDPDTGLPLLDRSTFYDGNEAYTWQIFYNGGDGNDVVLRLNAIPEPATLALLGLGALGLIRRRRRKA